jgi:hypothetical protein
MSLVNMQGKFIVKAGGAGGGGGISAPSNVSISSKTSSGFTVSWNAVASALGYKLDVATDSGFSSFVTGYNGKDVAGTSQAVTGLTQNTTYYVRVRAVATGSNSGSVSDTTETATLPLNAGLRNGLQAFYKLDDTTDASGNGNTLTNNNSVTFSSGKIGNAAVFNGSNRLTTSSNISIGSSDFSISSWVNFSSLGNSIINLIMATNAGLALYYAKSWYGTVDKLVVSKYGVSNQREEYWVPNLSQWYHIAVTRSGSDMKVFINGSDLGTTTNNEAYSQSAPLQIGGEPYTMTSYDVSVDAVGIWNRALTESEITELYNSGSGLE